MITGGAVQADEAVENSFKAGVIDFITKPIRAIEFLARVQSGLIIKRNHDLLMDEIKKCERVETALLKSRQRFKTVADFTYDWESWIAPDKRYIYVSPSCQRISGYAPDDFINNPDLLMELIHPDDKAIMIKHCQTIDKSDEIDSIEFRIITKNGDEKWIGHVCQRVYDNDGQFIGVRSSNCDITESKKMQEEVIKVRKLESLGTMAGGIAHDFNNLLFMVMGNISLAQEDLDSESITFENLKEAEEACIKAKLLTSSLITFSKGGAPIKKIGSIDDLLKDAVISALQDSNIEPVFFITDAIRQVNVDEDQIRHVFNNLTINAKEAMGVSGQLKVSYDIVIAEEDYLTLEKGEYIKITFEDQGCGILKENLDQIFDPYFSTKIIGTEKGQGLGLAVSYSIIEKHNGLITVESEPDMGSTFCVYLQTVST